MECSWSWGQGKGIQFGYFVSERKGESKGYQSHTVLDKYSEWKKNVTLAPGEKMILV